MNKILVVVTITMLLFSGAGIMSTSASQTMVRHDTISCSLPTLTSSAQSTLISIPEASTYSHDPGMPQLPIITKTYTYPIGTTFDEIRCDPGQISYTTLQGQPATAATIISYSQDQATLDSASILSAPYPVTWYSSHIGVGLKGTEHVVYVTIQFFPVRYLPETNQLASATEASITITSNPPKTSFSAQDYYSLVIIGPRVFMAGLMKLAAHKIANGISTKIVTTEQIYRDYGGRDKPEKIKTFIQHAVAKWGTGYVLLFGGMKGQRFWSWHVPIRYSNLDDDSDFETSYISDLYYADVYKYNVSSGYTFDDWDSNGNGIFAEWTNTSQDVLDLYPDVYVGRIPCRYVWDVIPEVDRIINYETTTTGQSWFNSMKVIGGDSFDDVSWNTSTDYLEGQEENAAALGYMETFNQTRIWVEGGDVAYTTENAIASLSEGEGFVYLSGHGNPMTWSTHPHGEFNTWIDFGLQDIESLSNGEKLPVLIVGGCHNCQFDCSLLKIYDRFAFMWGEVTTKSWGWEMASAPNGGSIATIGNTGLGYGTIGDGPSPPDEVPGSEPDGIPDCIQYLGGWLEPHFFEVYHDENYTVLGEMHGQTITNYLNQFPINWSMNWADHESSATLIDVKTVQQWVLFGDPSLQIGGIPLE
jgi:hypothetical protein